LKKSQLLKDLENHIGKNAVHKNSQATATAIYFIFKQNAVSIDNKRIYTSVLKGVKKYLSEDFGWSMMEIHNCFCQLNRLLKYLKCT
jgi:hypothetical protein